MSRSSREMAKSNLWSGSVETVRASSLSSVRFGRRRQLPSFSFILEKLREKGRELTLRLQEPSNPIPLFRRDLRQNLCRSLQVSTKDSRLVLDDREREPESVEVDVLVAEVDAVVRGEVAEEVHLAVETSKRGAPLAFGEREKSEREKGRTCRSG